MKRRITTTKDAKSTKEEKESIIKKADGVLPLKKTAELISLRYPSPVKIQQQRNPIFVSFALFVVVLFSLEVQEPYEKKRTERKGPVLMF